MWNILTKLNLNKVTFTSEFWIPNIKDCNNALIFCSLNVKRITELVTSWFSEGSVTFVPLFANCHLFIRASLRIYCLLFVIYSCQKVKNRHFCPMTKIQLVKKVILISYMEGSSFLKYREKLLYTLINKFV